jgi:hypothetical protein
VSAAVDRAPAPFIVGVGRSGTTLLRLMLDAHPDLAIPPETVFVPELIAAADAGADPDGLLEFLRSTRRWPDLQIPDSKMLERFRASPRLDGGGAARAMFALYAERQGKHRWGDKTPKYSLHMRELEDALPEARFVHLLRDGRDVALSRARMVTGRGDPPPPATRVARRWKRRIEEARELSRSVSHYLEIRYEDLVTDTEPTLRRVCEFIELDWDPRMLEYHAHAGERLEEMQRALPAKDEDRDPVSAGQRMQVHALASEPPKRSRVAAWKTEMDASQQAGFERIAGDLLAELGYEVGPAPAER